jgi:hypothetical protein
MLIPIKFLVVVALLQPSIARSTPGPLEDRPTLQVTLICPNKTIICGERIRIVARLTNRSRESIVVARPVPNCELDRRPIAYCWKIVKEDGKPPSCKHRETERQASSLDVEDFLILSSGKSVDMKPLAVDELFAINDQGKYQVEMTYCFDRRLLRKTGQDSIAERAFGLIARTPTVEFRSMPITIEYVVPGTLRDAHSRVTRWTAELERIDSKLTSLSNEVFELSLNKSDAKRLKDLEKNLE